MDAHDQDITALVGELVATALAAGRELGRAEARLEWHLQLRALANDSTRPAPDSTRPAPAARPNRKRGELEADVLALLRERAWTRADLDARFGTSVGPLLRRLRVSGQVYQPHHQRGLWAAVNGTSPPTT